MEYNSLMTIAHRAEDLSPLSGKSPSTLYRNRLSESVRSSFQTIDFFRQEIDHIENGQSLTDDIDTLYKKLIALSHKFRRGDKAQADASSVAPSASGAFPMGSRSF